MKQGRHQNSDGRQVKNQGFWLHGQKAEIQQGGSGQKIPVYIFFSFDYGELLRVEQH